MKEILSIFFYNALHPFKCYDSSRRLNLAEVVGVSWLVHLVELGLAATILSSIMTLLKINLPLSGDFEFFSRLNLGIKILPYIFNIVMAIFYPVWLVLGFYISSFILQAIFYIYQRQRNAEQISWILKNALCSNGWRLLPIFGKTIAAFLSVVFIYAGLKKVLGLSSITSFLIIVASGFFSFFLMAIPALIVFILLR